MTRKFLSLSILLSAFLLSFSSVSFASGADSEDGGEDPTGFIMHHIKDSHEWHFFNVGHTHVTLSLPVIVYSGDRGLEVFSSKDFQDHETHAFGEEHAHEGYFIDSHDHMGRVDGASFTDLSITKNVVMMFLVIAVVLILSLSAAGHYKKHGAIAPKGAAAIVEPIVIFVRDEIAHKAIGPKYKKFVPYLLTLFFFIWIGNLIGLLPGAANLTGNIAVTATLAVLTFIIVNVILAFIALVFIFESYTIGVVSTLMVTFINMIELLVATIQAYVFTLFTAMYIGSAVAEHAHDEAH